MKKMMMFMFLLLAGLVHAQDKSSLKDIDELTFFGVDFSMAKVYGAEESAAQFKEAFTGINNLFLREPKKYDTAKAFKAVVTTNVTPSLKLIDSIDASTLFAESNNYSLSDEEIAEHLSKFDTRDAEGYGALFMAGLLDKGNNRATYTVVLFNIGTKEVIDSRSFTEKARGFGLRNFWAYPVYQTLGRIRKVM